MKQRWQVIVEVFFYVVAVFLLLLPLLVAFGIFVFVSLQTLLRMTP